MKKIIMTVALILSMCISLFACGNKEEKQDNNLNAPNAATSSGEENYSDDDINGAEERDISSNLEFETEYKVEEYKKGMLIVSKSDGLLFGVVNSKNEEIIPVQYDKISFLESKFTDKLNKQFVLAKYENQYSVFNQLGEKIIDSVNGEVEIVDYVHYDASTKVKFALVQYGRFILFDENGEKIVETDIDKFARCSPISKEWISDKYFILSGISYEGGMGVTQAQFIASMCDYVGNILENQDGYYVRSYKKLDTDNQYYLFVEDYNNAGGGLKKVKINEDGRWGKISESNESELEQGTMHADICLGDEEQYRLFVSNGTWKYVDSNDSPVFDERYFSMQEINDAYFLSNEDKEICVLTKNGAKVLDYGRLFKSSEEGMYEFDGSRINEDNIFADEKSLCIVTSSENGERVYFFGEV